MEGRSLTWLGHLLFGLLFYKERLFDFQKFSLLCKRIPNSYSSLELVISLLFSMILCDRSLLPITTWHFPGFNAMWFSWNHWCKIKKSISRFLLIRFRYFPVEYSVVIGIITKVAFGNKHETYISKYIKQKQSQLFEKPSILDTWGVLNTPLHVQSYKY